MVNSKQLITSLIVSYLGLKQKRKKSSRAYDLGVLFNCACLLSRMCLLSTSWTVACQAPLSMGFFHARTLEWVAIASSRGSSRLKDQTRASCGSYIGREISPTMPSAAGNTGFGVQCPNQAAGSASEQIMVAPWENA